MAPETISLLVFVATTLLVVGTGAVVYHRFFRYREILDTRIRETGGDPSENRLFSDLRSLHDIASEGTPDLKQRLQAFLLQSQCALTLPQLAGSSLAAGVVGGLAAWWLVSQPLAAVAAATAAAFFPYGILRQRRRRHLQRISSQLPDAFDLIARAVRSGQTITRSLQVVADELDPPLSAEMSLCCQQQQLGVRLETALRSLAERTGVVELRIFVIALLVQAKSGGKLPQLLDTLSKLVRNRLRSESRIRSLTAEGRMQAMVLMLLPAAGLAAMSTIAPDYAQTLFDHPWLIQCGVVAQLVAACWIKTIISPKY